MKKKTDLYNTFLNELTYDYNFYTESELVTLYKKKLPILNFIYYEEPNFLNVKNIKINIKKEFNKYNYNKILNEKDKNYEIEPVLIKSPSILEDYYKKKKIKFVKVDKEFFLNKTNSYQEKINIYTKLEKTKILNLKLEALEENGFTSFD